MAQTFVIDVAPVNMPLPVVLRPRKFKRITAQGLDRLRPLLPDYFYEQKMVAPTEAQMNLILEEIRLLPDCKGYTIDKLRKWFYTHRRAANMDHALDKHVGREVIEDNRTSPEMAARKSEDVLKWQIRVLKCLATRSSCPPSTKIKVWASALGMGPQVVAAFFELLRCEKRARKFFKRTGLTSLSNEVDRRVGVLQND
ncbi:hypothetical protein VNI00_011705 [Paramarasmius palmivorus]|uniref:Uncharacterized protein n=1 Tax=Paramarasmius palmivorus TaxID=297713 RepID=A0AAW0CE40_9AGAR